MTGLMTLDYFASESSMASVIDEPGVLCSSWHSRNISPPPATAWYGSHGSHGSQKAAVPCYGHTKTPAHSPRSDNLINFPFPDLEDKPPVWMPSNRSSSSSNITGVDASIPPGGRRVSHDYNAPPPQHLRAYEAKPLPPAPNRRLMASMRSELSNALRTPQRTSYDYQEKRFEREGDKINVMLDAFGVERDVNQQSHQECRPGSQHGNRDNGSRFSRHADRQATYQSTYQSHQPAYQSSNNEHQRHTLPQLGTDYFPNPPADDILSPQPREPISKILQLAGRSTKPAASPIIASPTLHNSNRKIRQLMGLDTGPNWRTTQTYRHDDVFTVSPLSSGSVYSLDLDATVSEPDADLAYTEPWSPGRYPEHPIRPHSQDPYCVNPGWRDHTASPVPQALTIRKVSSRSSVGTESPGETHKTRRRSSGAHGSADGPRHHQRIDGGLELYHATTRQIFKSTTSSFFEGVTQSRVRVAPPTELRTGGGDAFTATATAVKTPYPRKDQSVWESDLSDGEEPSKLARIFKRTSAVPQPSSSRSSTSGWGFMQPPTPLYASKSASSSAYSLSGVSTGSGAAHTQERVVVTNRSRRVDGPDTPMPPGLQPPQQNKGGQFRDFMAQAKRTAGMIGKSDRKQESTTNKIWIIPESKALEGAGDDKKAG